MRPEIDRSAVLTGAAVGVVIAFVTFAAWGAIVALTGIDDDETNWVFVPTLVVMAGLATGSAVAARRRPDAPYTHALLAALLAYVVFVVVRVIVGVVADNGVPVGVLVFMVFPVSFFAILGALVGGRPR